MLTFRCTKKAQDLIGLKAVDLAVVEQESYDSLLGAWYVNVFLADRRKCLLFMNERTLLSFILFGVRKTNTKKETLPDVFINGLVQLFIMEGISDIDITRLVNEYEHCQFTKTNSRKVLGNMKDIAALYEHLIWHGGGLNHCDLNDIIQRINRTPQRNLGWGYSIDNTRELLGAYAT